MAIARCLAVPGFSVWSRTNTLITRKILPQLFQHFHCVSTEQTNGRILMPQKYFFSYKSDSQRQETLQFSYKKVGL